MRKLNTKKEIMHSKASSSRDSICRTKSYNSVGNRMIDYYYDNLYICPVESLKNASTLTHSIWSN